MWSQMKSRFGVTLLLLLLVGTLFSPQAKASHLMGCEASLECISPCVVRVNFRCYRDCTGSSFISPNSFSFVPQTTGCGQPTPIQSSWPTEVVTEVTPICASITTQCSNPSATINGVEEYFWFRDYDVCAQPNCIYTLEYSTCCRNPTITNIDNPGSQSIFIGSTTLNTNIQPCNNSPFFTNPPVPYVCAGQAYTFNQGAVDPEGDSLAYSLGPCYTTSLSNPVPYSTGYSATQPLGPSWNVVIDALTGDITLNPQPGNIETAVICVYVEEWRNGVLINTIVRDMQMTVITCPNNTVPTINNISNITGGAIDGPFEATVCAGTPISFDIGTNDPDAGQNLTFFWNGNLVGGTFTGGGQTDTITGVNPTGTINWTPQTTGVYTFLVTVQDDACPILGQNQATITINVNGGLPNSGITATPTGCTNVSLNANPGTGNTGPYTYFWYGDGNLNVNPNINTQTFSHTYPGPGSYEVNVLITDSYGCQSTLTDTVDIVAGPTADAGPDITMCSGYSINLGSPNIGGQSYNWFPSTGLSNSTVSDPVFTYTNTSATPDTLNFTVSATSGFCTSFDYLTIVVNPTPTANITGPAQICDGDMATLTATGGSSYLWSTNETTGSINTTPNSAATYTVTAIDNGCASLPASFTVNVTPGPTAIVTGIDSVCGGSDAILTVAGGTDWVWSTGDITQTITLNNLYGDSTISVTPSDNGCVGLPVDYTVYLHNKPVADFTATEECLGNSTAFTDASTMVNGSVIAWNWDFNDPSSGPSNASASQSPSHTFTSPGTYNVRLVVSSSNGCRDTVINPVTVNPLPVPDFDFDDVCLGFEMFFTDQSTSAAGVTDWGWDFGNGSTSTQQNPVHTYSAAGPFNVTLTVTDANGCSNEIVKTVFVHPNPVAEFSYVNTCFNTITNFSTSSYLNDPYGTTLDAHSWNFGDPGSGADNTSNDPNPTHGYTNPGTYNVTLTVITSRGCVNTITLPVVVAPIPPLQVEHDTVCNGYSGLLLITGGWQPGTTLEWFHTATSTVPFHVGTTYATPPVNAETVYFVAQRDPLDGCLSPKVPVFVRVNVAPRADVTITETELEIPNAITEFQVDFVHHGPVVSWSWDFGDGNTSIEESPVHQYTEVGLYDITLNMVDDFGCETTQFYPRSVNVTKYVAIYVPNAFSPDGNDLNDQFYVVPRLITDFDILIYDRWGKLVYQSSDQNFRWDGDFGGQPLPEGVYTYMIEAVEIGGEQIKKAGTITLVRTN